MLAFGLLILGLFGGRGDARSGIHYRLSRKDRPLFAVVKNLPKDAVVAGFPRGTMDDLPLTTRRSAFLTRQTHMPYNVGMTLSMRTRMNALIDAYFARELEPLRRLRDEFGVTHLLVDTAHYVRTPPSYFAPFNERIRERFRATRGDFMTIEQRDRGAIFSDGRRFLLDLDRLR